MTIEKTEPTYVTHQELEVFREMIATALEKAFNLFEGQAINGQTHLIDAQNFLSKVRDMQHDPLK